MGMKVSDLTPLTQIDSDDLIHVVDVSDTTHSAEGTSKKITVDNLLENADGSLTEQQAIMIALIYG